MVEGFVSVLASSSFEQIIKASPVGMLLVGSQGEITFANPTIENIFGYSQGELIGQVVDKLVPGARRARHRGFREAYSRDLTPRPMGVGRDLYGQRKDGAEFPVEVSLTPLETTEGSSVLATVADITGRKSIEHALQSSLLPHRLPRSELFSLACRYRPGTTAVEVEVGGDWFDAIYSDSRLTLVIGDVAGHDVEATTIMGAARHTVATAAIENKQPGEILTLANQYLRRLRPAMVTCLVVRLDFATGAACGASAGHLPMALCPPGGGPRLVEVKPQAPLGLRDAQCYNDEVVEIPSGSTIVLYTDGLIERRDRPIASGLDMLLHTLADLKSWTAEELADHLLLGRLTDGLEDDVALLISSLSDEASLPKVAS